MHELESGLDKNAVPSGTSAETSAADGPSVDPGRRAGKASLWRGAAVMGIAMLISKVIGTLQKIPLQNIAGDRVFGIYNAVYPLYQLLLVMVTAGFPVAVSLLVAEREAVGDHAGSRRVLGASALLLSISGAAGFILLWVGADWIASWIGDRGTAPAIRMAALALWVVPLMAALRGYYQGLGRMLPSAISQLTEQSVRVAAMLMLLAAGWQLGWAEPELAAGATAGSAIGGAVGLGVMVAYWLRDPRRRSGERRNDSSGDVGSGGTERDSRRNGDIVQDGSGSGGAEQDSRRNSDVVRSEARDFVMKRGDVPDSRKMPRGLAATVRRLSALALPVALGALAVPVLSVVDAFSIPRLLRDTGASAADSLTLFGLYSRGQPLVQLVVMVAGAIGAALVPALAAARMRGDQAAVRQHAALAMRAAWSLGAAAAVGLVILAEPINVLLYADDKGSLAFALVGCTALAGTVNAVAAAMLQGIGLLRGPMLFMLAAAALKAALNAVLVPPFGIAGAACAGIAALAVAALLSAGAVRRATGAAMPARHAAGIGLALAVMAAALILAERGGAALLGPALPPRAAAAALALGGTALGAALFFAAALRSGCLQARDLRALPGGEAIASRLRRWRLLPRGE
ncbi:Lipid II flippase MurJ [Paenibacillus plantiphilus]|uniref:Lipid II flippase MurJ n=1 Tax=Paenibacillus plantiphilus TaxID=2905650 RepID=A0ABM9CS78_9BACL|nr:polysaccharide biosynthesis protein [Paenibacillus plantiphilus]CAH1222909.1 Lipid II flippase MurJ [Paenibacillus plantiphilus]